MHSTVTHLIVADGTRVGEVHDASQLALGLLQQQGGRHHKHKLMAMVVKISSELQTSHDYLMSKSAFVRHQLALPVHGMPPCLGCSSCAPLVVN